MGEWGVALNGSYLSGGDGSQLASVVSTPACSGVTLTTHGCLSEVPQGLGLPSFRSEDVTYGQRDGVKHNSDWYDARVIAIHATIAGDNECNCTAANGYGRVALTAKQKARAITNAWSRVCADEEMVIYTDCHSMGVTGVDRATNGPFGVVGRPRQAEVQWMNGAKVADLLLRFDAADHRLYILDQCGTPGSGGQTVVLKPVASSKCRTYPRCYTNGASCYSTPVSGASTGTGPTSTVNIGDLCAYPTITLTGPLTSPRVQQQSTGQTMVYGGNVAGPIGTPGQAGYVPAQVIVIDAYNGTAIDQASGNDVTYLLSGSLRMQINPGNNVLQLVSFASGDTGTAQVYYRPAVQAA